ncbi:MAG: 16S rRNA (uracil(1498)-N(3))-methyltransferase [Paracoccaceae bacterium]
MAIAKIRLYVEHPLGSGQSVPLNRDQAHYLFGVMRLKTGDPLLLLNGTDGEFLALVAVASKRGGVVRCETQTKPLQMPPDLWFLFAPIKKARTDFIVEKAAEMGAAQIMPVLTKFTNNDRVRQDKLQAHAVEAAEQCGGTYVPEVHKLQKLTDLLDKWPTNRRLMFCDEALVGMQAMLGDKKSGPWAILVGPEGGFSEAERERLQAMEQASAISLGPRILRADTAAVAALTVWQTKFGDW